MSRSRCVWLIAALYCAACSRQSGPVVVATDVPEMLARPMLNEFGTDRGVTVDRRSVNDADADLVWSRDPEAALQLAARHALAALPGGDYGRPASMIDPARGWIATSAIARVLVYDPARIADDDVPTKTLELSRPAVGPRLVLADPTHGAAAWQAAALVGALGEGPGLEFYRALLTNGALVVGDEDAVAAHLQSGDRALALTDSDRALALQEQRPNLVISFPDQEADGAGVFVLPAVVGLTARGAGNPAAGALLDFLVSAPVTRRLAMTANAILVLNDAAEEPAGLLSIGRLRVMPVSYADVAARLPATRAALSRLHSGALTQRGDASDLGA